MGSSGWNKPLAANKPTVKVPKKPSAMRGIAAGLVVVAVAVACILIFMGKEGDVTVKKSEKKPTRIKEVTPAPAKNTEPEAVEKKAPEKKPEPIVLSASTNAATGVVMQTIQYPDGHQALRRVAPPPLFTNLSDQAIMLVISENAGARIPPLPPMSDEAVDKAFQQSLLEPITLSKDDNEKTTALKMAVKTFREDIKALIKSGDDRSVAQMIRDYVEDHESRIEIRDAAIRELEKVCASEGEDFIKEYVEKVNEHLSNYGIEPIERDPVGEPADDLRHPNRKGETK